jgi:hypothetical protein
VCTVIRPIGGSPMVATVLMKNDSASLEQISKNQQKLSANEQSENISKNISKNISAVQNV